MAKNKLENNPMLDTTALEVTGHEVAEQVEQVVEVLPNETMLSVKRAELETVRRQLEIESRESNLHGVQKINKAIEDILQSISDPEIFQRVAEGVKNGKDLNELVKAVQGMIAMRDSLMEHSLDENLSGRKKKKFQVAFQTQGCTVAISGETE